MKSAEARSEATKSSKTYSAKFIYYYKILNNMATIAHMLFGYNASDEIISLFCNDPLSQADAKKVSDAFIEKHARGIVAKLNTEYAKGLESIHYEADSPEELFTDAFIFGGVTHKVGNVIATAYSGYKLA